jgi:hypothetical protein
MDRLVGFKILALGCALLISRVGLAEDTVTDANIITALDISESIDADDILLEIAGMAQAIRSPEVLGAIESGHNGQIGFAVFAWHYNQFPVVVPWMLIASREDANAAADEIEARLRVNVNLEARKNQAFYVGRLTDLSQAIDHANEMLGRAPFATDRSVVNVVGNGSDNVGEDAHFARDRIVEIGATVNGVVLDDDPIVRDYYRRQVIGGPGAFVMSVGETTTMVNVLRRKFWYEIAMMAPPGAVADPAAIGR